MTRIYEISHYTHGLAHYKIKQIFAFVSCLFLVMTSMAEESLDALRKRARNHDKDAVLQLRERLEPSANEGDVKAMIELAEWYYHPIPTSRVTDSDRQKAFELYLLAAARGCAFGMYSVGRCYDWGSGVTKNKEMATKWYRKAADHGCYEACCKLAGEIRNKGEEEKFWRKAADSGILGAYYELAWRFCGGDDARAVSWYRKCLEIKKDGADAVLTDGKPHHYEWVRWRALFGMACFYKENRGNLVRDSAEALEWHRKVVNFCEENRNWLGWEAHLGQVSYAELAQFHFQGRHVPMDFAKGVRLLKIAAELGDGDSCHKLANYYMLGLSGPINGDLNKMVQIVEADQDEVLHWQRKGAKQGNYDCIYGLCVSLLLHKKYDEACKWLEMGAKERGEHEGFFKYYLSICYLKGDGCTKDVSKARRLLKEAAEKGFDKAIEMCKRAKLSY